jgi:hypothetical protein
VFYGPENYSNVRDTPGADDAKIGENRRKSSEISIKHSTRRGDEFKA